MKADNSLASINGWSRVGLAALLLTFASAAAAEPRPPLGDDAKNWLELQKAQKPRADEGMSGEQAAVIWERHINSFGREIPETLKDQGSVSRGGTR